MKRTFLLRFFRLFILITPIITSILVVTSCIPTKEVTWDSRFVERFHPTVSAMAQAKTGIHNVNIDAVNDGITLHLGQTIGDGKTIYIALDVVSTDIIDANDVEIESVQFYNGKIAYNDIIEKDIDEILCGKSIEQQAVDADANSIPYIISFIAHDRSFFDSEITMIIQVSVQNGSEQAITSKPFVMSWIPKNKGSIYDLSLNNDAGNLAGRATLSALSFYAELFSFGYDTFEELVESVEIIMKDGSIVKPKGSMSGSFTSTLGYHTIRWQFSEILILKEVKSLQIGGYKIII